MFRCYRSGAVLVHSNPTFQREDALTIAIPTFRREDAPTRGANIFSRYREIYIENLRFYY
jgi:hypothetical protein